MGFHAFSFELAVRYEWLAVVAFTLMVVGAYLCLKCLLELNAISPRRALLALALVVSAILVSWLLVAVFTEPDSLLLALLLVLASTLLVRKPLNTFKLKAPRTHLGTWW